MNTGFVTRCLVPWVAGAALAAGAPSPAHAALLGPTAYLSSADSPFSPFAGFTYFHLENFEDGLLNTPGVSAVGAGNCVTNTVGCSPGSPFVDSVDADDGAIDGNGGLPGHSLFRLAGSTGITFVFDAGVLGALPTAVGIVWTDGGFGPSNLITFEAFDQDGLSLGTVTGTHADFDNFGAGSTAEDRFYGATNSGGISKLLLKNTLGGIEMDHLQYGLLAPTGMPEPGTLALIGISLGALGFSRRRKPR